MSRADWRREVRQHRPDVIVCEQLVLAEEDGCLQVRELRRGRHDAVERWDVCGVRQRLERDDRLHALERAHGSQHENHCGFRREQLDARLPEAVANFVGRQLLGVLTAQCWQPLDAEQLEAVDVQLLRVVVGGKNILQLT